MACYPHRTGEYRPLLKKQPTRVATKSAIDCRTMSPGFANSAELKLHVAWMIELLVNNSRVGQASANVLRLRVVYIV